MVCEVFYVASQVNFLSSLPHVEDSGIANLVVTDLSGLLLTSIHCGDMWPSLQLLEEKKISQTSTHDTSEDHKQEDDF